MSISNDCCEQRTSKKLMLYRLHRQIRIDKKTRKIDNCVEELKKNRRLVDKNYHNLFVHVPSFLSICDSFKQPCVCAAAPFRAYLYAWLVARRGGAALPCTLSRTLTANRHNSSSRLHSHTLITQKAGRGLRRDQETSSNRGPMGAPRCDVTDGAANGTPPR